MSKIFMLLALLLLAGCGPSCEEQGDTRRLKYYMPIVTMVGKIPVTSMSPVYSCEIEKR